jgi:hypothetical protein
LPDHLLLLERGTLAQGSGSGPAGEEERAGGGYADGDPGAEGAMGSFNFGGARRKDVI